MCVEQRHITRQTARNSSIVIISVLMMTMKQASNIRRKTMKKYTLNRGKCVLLLLLLLLLLLHNACCFCKQERGQGAAQIKTDLEAKKPLLYLHPLQATINTCTDNRRLSKNMHRPRAAQCVSLNSFT